MDRRRFFQLFTLNNKHIRPPYNIDESLFKECMECDMPCVKVCEESIIHITEDHTPYLNFDNSGCTFCTNCAKVCEKGVLNQHLEAKINSIALINKELCIAWNMTLCSSCTDVCYPKSITFSRMLNPQIDQNTCNGCGLCKNICPLSAITIEYKK